jgi:hypothetical protein
MRYTFETDIEEQAMLLLHSQEAFAALVEIYNTARNQLKHGSPDDCNAALERIKTLAHETMELVQ